MSRVHGLLHSPWILGRREGACQDTRGLEPGRPTDNAQLLGPDGHPIAGAPIRFSLQANYPSNVFWTGDPSWFNVSEVDVVMLLRMQFERQREALFPTVREYTARYGLTRERARLLSDDALVMHPGPMNRGVEIAADVADLPRSVITRQVANGVAVRMAVLFLMLGSAGGRGA